MRGLRFTLFALAFVSLTAELVRHSYIRFVEKHESVLDHYDAIRNEIKGATSLETLRQRYAEELDKDKAAKAQQPPSSPDGGGPAPGFVREDSESPVVKLRQAITNWEEADNSILELRFFWGAGLALLLLALACHLRGFAWLSVCLQAAGFAEMTWWTSPTYSYVLTMGAANEEFSRLLENKLAFTTLALALLLAFWQTGILRPTAPPPGEAAG